MDNINQQTQPAPTQPSNPPEKKSSHSLLYILFASVALVIAAIGFLMMSKKNPEPTPSPSAVAPPSPLQPSAQPTQTVKSSATTNTQLDKDGTTIQNLLNQLTKDHSTASQDVGSESKDIPPQ